MAFGVCAQVEVHNEQGLVAAGNVSIGSLWQVRLLYAWSAAPQPALCSEWMQTSPAAGRLSGYGHAMQTRLLMLHL